MQCMFLRRKYSEPPAPTLADLADNMTIIRCRGVSYSSATNNSVYFTLTEAPANGVAYAFSICLGYIGIWKIVNQVIQSTPIMRMSSSNGGLYLRTSNNRVYYYAGGYSSGTSYGTSVYGATVALLTFSKYSTTQIDNCLSNLHGTSLVAANSSTVSNLRTMNTTNTYIIAACESKMDIRNGSTWALLGGTTTAAASISDGYLSLGAKNAGSIIGINPTS